MRGSSTNDTALHHSMRPDHRSAEIDNVHVAQCLRQAAELLQAQGANPFRVTAYRNAADTVERFGGSLRGLLDPTTLFQTVPGIGPELALRIHDALGVDTLEALEVACHEGRLAEVP